MYARDLEEAEPFQCAGIRFGMLLSRDFTEVLEVVWEQLEPFQSTPADEHASFDQLFVVLKGRGEVTVGRTSREIKPMSVVFIPRATQHSVRCNSGERLEYYFVNIWRTEIPDAEKDWKMVYALIHDRRTVEGTVKR